MTQEYYNANSYVIMSEEEYKKVWSKVLGSENFPKDPPCGFPMIMARIAIQDGVPSPTGGLYLSVKILTSWIGIPAESLRKILFPGTSVADELMRSIAAGIARPDGVTLDKWTEDLIHTLHGRIKTISCVIAHELHERGKMLGQGKSYDKAHEEANEFERKLRIARKRGGITPAICPEGAANR